MKRYIMIPTILLFTSFTHASESMQTDSSVQKYQECIAVSLFTIEGRELNAMVNNDREITRANLIPDGWSVVGVTTRSDSDTSNPYMVICH